MSHTGEPARAISEGTVAQADAAPDLLATADPDCNTRPGVSQESDPPNAHHQELGDNELLCTFCGLRACWTG